MTIIRLLSKEVYCHRRLFGFHPRLPIDKSEIYDILRFFNQTKQRIVMNDTPNCVKCNSTFTYFDGSLFVCPECGHEWTEGVEPKIEKVEVIVKDAHGNVLKDGDTVTIIQDIKVKGSSSVIKVGLKVKDIRLVDPVNGHNIDAKVPGFGAMMLKSEIVKKSS